ncbi:MAG: hypothetical protein K0S35_1689 [Geminicoccaceae bacterium]|nr:hypothetical protein [Geminicoccaceae bacterium]
MHRDVRVQQQVAIVCDEPDPLLVVATGLDPRLRLGLGAPRPDVAEPQVWQNVQQGVLGTSVRSRDPDAQVFGRGLGVFDRDVPVAVPIEDPGVEQLELRTLAGAPPVLLDQPAIRIFLLRVLVEVAHVGVGRRVVRMVVVFLDVLAVIAVPRGHAEQPLLEVRVPAVPERRREAQELVAVADPGDPVLAPAIGLGACLLVAEGPPGIAALRVVLAHRAPGAFREVRTPAAPAEDMVADLGEPGALGILGPVAMRRRRAGALLHLGRHPRSGRARREGSAARRRIDSLLGRVAK